VKDLLPAMMRRTAAQLKAGPSMATQPSTIAKILANGCSLPRITAGFPSSKIDA